MQSVSSMACITTLISMGWFEGGPTKGDDEKEPEIKPAKGIGGKSSAKAKGGDEDGDGEYAIENAKSSRSTCKSCNEKIEKGQVCIGAPLIEPCSPEGVSFPKSFRFSYFIRHLKHFQHI